MIFVTLAIGRGSSAASSYRGYPVSRSKRVAEAAVSSGGVRDGSGVTRTLGYGDGEP